MSLKLQIDETDSLQAGNREIERRIDQIGDSLIEGSSRAVGEDTSRPRFISAAELVRRVQPFLGTN